MVQRGRSIRSTATILFNTKKLKTMKIYSEKSLRNFEFWSGAKENANELTGAQLDEVETILEDLYPEGMDETQINDLFWFDFDTVKEWLNITDEEEEEE